jgi:hypothetical protein
MLRRERELPNEMISSTERPELNRQAPKIATVDPRREKLRRLSALPRWRKSKTLTLLPTRENERSDKALPRCT